MPPPFSRIAQGIFQHDGDNLAQPDRVRQALAGLTGGDAQGHTGGLSLRPKPGRPLAQQGQAGRSDYAPYHAAGGFYGADSNLTWSHQLTPEWGALVSVDYTWLDRNTKDSPIVFRRNGTSATLGVLYSF